MRLKIRGVHIAFFSGALLMSTLSACCMAQDDVDDVMKAGRTEILANPFTKEDIGRIVRMDIAHVEEPFLYPQRFSTWYSETNLFFITNAVSVLSLEAYQDIPVPFSGILSYQIFYDGHGDVIAVVQIINTPGSVILLDRRFEDLEESSTDSFITSSPEYCRMILKLMREHCFDQIKKMEQFYGIPLDDLILKGLGGN